MDRYENQPEPELNEPSVTIKASEETVADMKRRAEQIWPPALAALMQVLSQIIALWCRYQHTFRMYHSAWQHNLNELVLR